MPIGILPNALQALLPGSIAKRQQPSLDAPEGIEVRAHARVAEIPSADWGQLFAGAPEGHSLYRAFETVPPPGFRLGALSVSERGRTIAAAPLFRMHFRFDTPFPGRFRAIGDWLQPRAPRLTGLSILGLGSPMSDSCSVGFDPGLSAEELARARLSMLDHLGRMADEEKAQVLVIKSLGPEMEAWHPELARLGYHRIKSVPVVMLATPFPSLDAYYASLPEKTRAYLKRKMRAADGLRIEWRDTVAGLEGEVMKLYEATVAQSQFDYGDFDKLHPDFFRAIVDEQRGCSKFMLIWKGDELVSFQVFLVAEKRIIASKIGMKYPEARELNLYFINWLKMIEYATENGIPEIEMGATTYQSKMMFGGKLEARWIYFRLRGAIANTLTKPFHPFFDFERNDPELKRMRAVSAAVQKAEGAVAAKAAPKLVERPNGKPPTPKGTPPSTAKLERKRAEKAARAAARAAPGMAAPGMAAPGIAAPLATPQRASTGDQSAKTGA